MRLLRMPSVPVPTYTMSGFDSATRIAHVEGERLARPPGHRGDPAAAVGPEGAEVELVREELWNRIAGEGAEGGGGEGQVEQHTELVGARWVSGSAGSAWER